MGYYLLTAFLSLLGLDTIHIGYTDAAKEGTWVWTDGGTGGYEHWGSKEPNNAGGNEDCAELKLPHWKGYWNDYYCDVDLHYVCQKGLLS